MSLVEEYYEMNESEEVSAVWKVLHIGFYACAACLGLWCGYTMAILRLRFDDRCYLFTEVTAPPTADEKIDQSSIEWESDMWCDYYQFSMVSSFIVAVIWATFFLMCGRGGKSLTGLPQPWRIVCSSLIFNFIYFLIILSTAVKIQQGTDYFCASHDADNITYKNNFTENCKAIKLLLKEDLQVTSVQLEIVTKTSWGCAVSWIVLLFLSLFRIVFVADFHMYKICVFKIDDSIQNKREEVLRITNYEEPKQLSSGKDEKEKKTFRPTQDFNFEKFDDLEAGNRKKAKGDKKSTRQNFNAASRAPGQTNGAVYVMADIRMLNREKRKKSSKVMDEAFGKSNKTPLGPELRKSLKFQSDVPDANDPDDTSEISKYSYRHSEDENDPIYSRSYRILLRNPDLEDSWDQSDSGGDVLSDDSRSNNSLGLKKWI